MPLTVVSTSLSAHGLVTKALQMVEEIKVFDWSPRRQESQLLHISARLMKALEKMEPHR